MRDYGEDCSLLGTWISASRAIFTWLDYSYVLKILKFYKWAGLTVGTSIETEIEIIKREEKSGKLEQKEGKNT